MSGTPRPSKGRFSVFDRPPTASDEPPADDEFWIRGVDRNSIRLAYAAEDEGLRIFVALDEHHQVHLLCRHNGGGSTSSVSRRSIVELGSSVTVEGNHLGWFAYGAVTDDVSAVRVDASTAVVANNVYVSSRVSERPLAVRVVSPTGDRVINL
jgi:hypothetical protein